MAGASPLTFISLATGKESPRVKRRDAQLSLAKASRERTHVRVEFGHQREPAPLRDSRVERAAVAMRSRHSTDFSPTLKQPRALTARTRVGAPLAQAQLNGVVGDVAQLSHPRRSNATRTAGARFRDQTRTYASMPRLGCGGGEAPRGALHQQFPRERREHLRLNLLPCHRSSRDWPSPRVSGSTVHAAPLDWAWTLWLRSAAGKRHLERHRSVAPRRLRRAAASRSL